MSDDPGRELIMRLRDELRAQAEEMKAFMLQGRMARATGGGGKKTVIEA